MWPNLDQTRRLLDDAKSGESAAVDRLLGEFREPLRQVINLRLDLRCQTAVVSMPATSSRTCCSKPISA